MPFGALAPACLELPYRFTYTACRLPNLDGNASVCFLAIVAAAAAVTVADTRGTACLADDIAAFHLSIKSHSCSHPTQRWIDCTINRIFVVYMQSFCTTGNHCFLTASLILVLPLNPTNSKLVLYWTLWNVFCVMQLNCMLLNMVNRLAHCLMFQNPRSEIAYSNGQMMAMKNQ